MGDYAMPAETALHLVETMRSYGVGVCVGGGWAVDALVDRQTRDHADLDVWVEARDTEGLLAACADAGVDRIHPWPGDRPWNFVLHDGATRRLDLHLYERLDEDRLHYGSVLAPFEFGVDDLSGQGRIAGVPVRCERAEFALANRSGYALRDVDHHDIAVLREHLRR